MYLFSLLIVFLVALLGSLGIRWLLVYLNQGWFSRGYAGDSSVHLEIVEQMRRGFAKKRIDRYVIPNTFSYPVFFHRICSLWPRSALLDRGYMPNLVIFALSSGVFATYTFHFQTAYLENDSVLFTITVVSVFLISVSNLVFGGPAIAYMKLSARLLGRVSTGFYFLFLAAYVGYGDNAALILAIITGGVAFASSTFAAQALLFSLPLLTLFLWSVEPVGILLAALLFAYIITKGHSNTSIYHMARYWRIYHRYVKNSPNQAAALSAFISPGTIWNSLRNGDVKLLIRHTLSREPTRSLLFYPELSLLAALFVLLALRENRIIDYWLYFAPILSLIILYALTSSRWLNFLGEGYRYLEYGLYFIAPFCIGLLILEVDSGTALAVMLGVYCSIVIVFTLFQYRYFRYSSTEDNLSRFLEALELSPGAVVFPVSMRLGADLCARTDCKSFWWQPGGITDPAMYEHYIQDYPYLRRDWKPLAIEHGVTHIIADKEALSQMHGAYDFSQERKLLEDEYFVAYRVQSLS
ncbi:MAG: hypothetical protein CMF59_02880 [Leptospiraceae bacterium]|nr:hypothetical protein [Leptospiraceae bacterium]